MRNLTIKKKRRGYTVVEVMSAMTLFAIGAAGVISMQRVTIQGGSDARHFDVATNIAREWQSRLQRDAMFWTLPDSDNPTAPPNFVETKWLNAAKGPWIKVPGSAVEGESGVFDLLGRDVDDTDPTHLFCAQYRLMWIADPGTPVKPTAILRAEIRVFWSHTERDPANCANPNPDADDPTAKNLYHFVYLPTALRSNPRR